MGAVEVEVTPISVTSGEKTIFLLSFNTHSVELDYDYTEITQLTDNVGNAYQALEWIGERGGHHLQGELIFPARSDKPEELILTIDGIDNTLETFVWKL